MKDRVTTNLSAAGRCDRESLNHLLSTPLGWGNVTRSPTVMHNYVRCQCSTGQLSFQSDTPLTANCAVTWNGRSSDGYVTILWLGEDKTVLLYSCVEKIQLGSKCCLN